MGAGWCMTSIIRLCGWSEVQCYDKSSYPLKHLLSFSWGRDVVDVKGCLSRYQENKTKNGVPSMVMQLFLS